MYSHLLRILSIVIENIGLLILKDVNWKYNHTFIFIESTIILEFNKTYLIYTTCLESKSYLSHVVCLYLT